MHVIDHDKWTDDVFRQAIAFKLVLWKTHRFKTSAVVYDFWRAMKGALVLRGEGKRVLLYAVTDYQTVLLPAVDWEHFRQLWEEKTRGPKVTCCKNRHGL